MISRRKVLTAGVAVASAAAVPVLAGRASGADGTYGARAAAAGRRGSVSDNGWRIDPDAVAGFRINGAGIPVRLHRDAAPALLHVARRWHYEVLPLTDGVGTVRGYDGDRSRVPAKAAYASNHLSGSALALHPGAFPLGGSEGLSPHREAVVRDILADCDGLVRWGGDLSPATVSHFHVAAAPDSAELAALNRRLRGWERGPGPGAGRVADPLSRERRRRAERVRKRQARRTPNPK